MIAARKHFWWRIPAATVTCFLAAAVASADPAPAATNQIGPQVVLNIPRLRILRWVLQPGEITSVFKLRLDRINVVVRGTGNRTRGFDGKIEASNIGPGWAEYCPAGGTSFQFANASAAPFEVVSIELKRGISGVTVPPNLKPGVLPPNQARLVTDRVVPSRILVDNDRIKMVRWIFEPGECSPIHIHALDHVYVVIRGAKIREITGTGKVNDDVQETGRAAFSPARGKIHSFANLGDATYEMVSVELK